MFDFLTELAENNNKEWFDAHKAHMNRLQGLLVMRPFCDFMTEALTTNLNRNRYRIIKEIELPIEEQYFGYYGSFRDKFGIG